MGTLSIFRLAQSNFQNVIAKHNHESGDSLADAINVLRARRLRLQKKKQQMSKFDVTHSDRYDNQSEQQIDKKARYYANPGPLESPTRRFMAEKAVHSPLLPLFRDFSPSEMKIYISIFYIRKDQVVIILQSIKKTASEILESRYCISQKFASLWF